MPFEHIHMIINPAAGQARPVLHTVNKVFHEHGIDWDVSITLPSCTGKELAQRASEAGTDLIVVYGGDGTVQDVVNGMLGHDTPLAILHGGTGNAMAYELGIPADLTQAAELIVGEHTLRRVDVGTVTQFDGADESRHFTLRAGIGLQTDILEAATRESKDQFGNLAYVVASLRSLTESELRAYRLTIDGESVDAEGLTCLITNSASVGGPGSFRFSPDVDPCDGQLDVFVLDTSFESLVAAVSSALEADTVAYKHHWTGREIHVETPVQQAVTVDGEPFGKTPVTASIEPEALRVVVPVGA